MISLKTKNCIICAKPASAYTGHVHKDKEIVIAGLCDEHNKAQYIRIQMTGCIGCWGQWLPAYGIIREKIQES